MPATGEDADGIERAVWATLYPVEDPEMPISIVDLGLIYGIDVSDGEATVDMTLTYSGCPACDIILDESKKPPRVSTESRLHRSGWSGLRTGPLIWSPNGQRSVA